MTMCATGIPVSWLARARAVRKITRHGAEVVADEGQRRPAVLDDHCLRHQRIVNAGADQLGVIPRAPPADRRRDVGGGEAGLERSATNLQVQIANLRFAPDDLLPAGGLGLHGGRACPKTQKGNDESSRRSAGFMRVRVQGPWHSRARVQGCGERFADGGGVASSSTKRKPMSSLFRCTVPLKR